MQKHQYTIENLFIPGGVYFPSQRVVIATKSGECTIAGINPQCYPDYSQYLDKPALSFYLSQSSATYKNICEQAYCTINYINATHDFLYSTSDFPPEQQEYGVWVSESDVVVLASLVEVSDRVINNIAHIILKAEMVYAKSGSIIRHDAELPIIAKKPIPDLMSLNPFAEKELDENDVVLIAAKINPNVSLTIEACRLIASSDNKNKKRLIKDSVKNAAAEGISIIDTEHVKPYIN